MQIRYTPTPRDVGALLRYGLRHSARLRLMLGGVALLPVVINSLSAAISRGIVTAGDVVPGLVLGVLAALALPLVARLRTKRDERELSIDRAGIRTSVGRFSGQVAWSRIASVDVTPEYVFITGRSANGFAVPSRAFATAEERAEFVRRIAEYRGAAT